MEENTNIFFQYAASFDTKLIRNRAFAQEVKILNPGFFPELRACQDALHSGKPDLQRKVLRRFLFNLEGKMDYPGPIDFMCAYPNVLGYLDMFWVISQKVKQVLEECGVSEDECLIFPIRIQNVEEPYYLMALLDIGLDRLNVQDCILWSPYYDPNYDLSVLEGLSSADDIRAVSKKHITRTSHLCLDGALRKRNILAFPYFGEYFFSSKLVRRLNEVGALGLKYYTSYHLPTLEFK